VRPISPAPVVGFDLDMTLVDSASGIAATLRAALSEVGRTVSDQQVWPLVGGGLEATVAALAPDVDVARTVSRYRELYPSVGVAPVTALPGAVEALDALRAAGGRVLVVSAKVEPAIRAVLAHVGLDRPPRGPDLVAGGLFAAAKAQVLSRHAADVYVGDHPGDVEAARAAGAWAVGVATGPHSAAELAAAGADVVLPGLAQFPGWLVGRLSEQAGRGW
jgi:phosphoglycolate phosphatase